MTPLEYENFVGQHFIAKGYSVDLTPQSNDYGVDLFATKASEKIAIQVKMYGQSRKINRKAIMELFGAKEYFDCTAAKIVTDGSLLLDAVQVAEKLNIEIIYLAPIDEAISIKNKFKSEEGDFFDVWEKYITPLEGKTLFNSQNKPNKILKVDFSGVQRVTSNGKYSKIGIEIFRESYNYVLKNGEITREYINQNFTGRASSGIILILSQIPFFKLNLNPAKIIFKRDVQ
jgi:restriction system protein